MKSTIRNVIQNKKRKIQMDKGGICVLVSSIFVSKLCPRFDQVKNIMDLGVLRYIYYRLIKFYKETFRIEESPGFLIQSCYSWGLLVLLISICFYLMSIEVVVLWGLGIKIKKAYVLITMLPFFIFHVFSEQWLGDEKKFYKDLCKKFSKEKYI